MISNVPSYSPETIAEYSVSIALQLVRRFPDIERRVQAHDFTWQAEIMSKPVKNMTVAIIGTVELVLLQLKYMQDLAPQLQLMTPILIKI